MEYSSTCFTNKQTDVVLLTPRCSFTTISSGRLWWKYKKHIYKNNQYCLISYPNSTHISMWMPLSKSGFFTQHFESERKNAISLFFRQTRPIWYYDIFMILRHFLYEKQTFKVHILITFIPDIGLKCEETIKIGIFSTVYFKRWR